MDIIKCKETERRKILSRFMDLDIFDQKHRLAKDEGKDYLQRLKDFEDSDLEMALVDFQKKAASVELKITREERARAVIRKTRDGHREDRQWASSGRSGKPSAAR